MALFENFPYTNLHELNLDWLINELKKMEEAEVLSVNGQTGHVILYQDANVILPEVQDSAWSFFRTADGVIRGITFAADGTAYIMNGDQLTELYTAANAPDFSDEHIQLPDLDDEQITNWNIYRNFNESLSGIQFDDTGSAYVISGGLRYKIFTQHDVPPYPVTSVNGQTGTVVLYPDPGVRFPDIIDNEVNYWSIFRYVNNGAYGIQFNTDGSIDLITPGNRTKIYTATDQPPYPVTSVNSMTGAVELDIPDDLVTHVDDAILEIAEPADNYTWGFTRETDNGQIGIVFDNQNNNGAYLRYYDSVNQEYVLVKLLTNADIPSAAGVSSVNGLTGSVNLYGSNIFVSNLDNRTLNEFTEESIEDNNSLLAFVETGLTASRNIPINSYVIWTGSLYKASTNITLGDSLSGSNLTAVSNGGFNELKDMICYKTGDTISYGTGFLMLGLVGANNKDIRVIANTPKQLTNISTVSVTDCVGGIRGSLGYINDYNANTNWLNVADVTVTAVKISDSAVLITFHKDTAFTTVDGTNKECTMYVTSLTLTLN